MKGRKISIVVSVASLILAGCGAGNENRGFIEVEKKTTVTTVTTVSKPVSSEALTEEPNEDNKNYWSEEDDLEEDDEEYVTTTQTFSEPVTIIPTNTVATTTTNVGTSQEQITSGSEKTDTTATTMTTSETTSTTTTDSQNVKNIQEVPDSILEAIHYWESTYPGIQIGFGLYNLDGTVGYEYNAYSAINSACTIKADFAMYVLKTCEAKGIDIYSDYIQYEPWQKDTGTSVISDYGTYYDWYSIDELLTLLLGESDNTAYTMLATEFPVSGMFQMNAQFGGQSDWSKWGAASVYQRKNEWVEIYRYINSGAKYSNALRQYLTNTNYCYLVQWMSGWHNYLHKSGWTEEEPSYPACNDCAIIDDSYMIIVMTQDYNNPTYGHIDVVQSLGYYAEAFYNYNGGDIF